MNNKISHVVVTGGPFHWLYYGAQLKKRFPGIKLITDFRDYWTGGEGSAMLSAEQQQSEAAKEAEVIKLADHVTTPALKIADYLKKIYPQQADKIVLLAHGYDSDEIPVASATYNQEDLITFIYGGILYEKMEFAIRQFAILLGNLVSKGLKVRADIYTFGTKYAEIFDAEGVTSYVNFHETLPARDFFRKCSEADFLLQFRAGEANEQHFRSTKFYELLVMRRYILYFGPPGEVSDFIVQNKAGFSANDGIEEMAFNICNSKKNNSFPGEIMEISTYDFRNLTSQFVRITE